MRLRKVALAVFVLAAIVIPQSLSAQVRAPLKPTCLEQAAAKIPLKSFVTVFQNNGEKVEGRLDSIDFAQSNVIMSTYQWDRLLGKVRRPYAFTISEITKIQYKTPRKTKPGYMLLGLLGGALVGGVVGSAVVSSGGGLGDVGGGPGGVLVGAGGGLLLGTIIPFFTSSKTYTFECK